MAEGVFLKQLRIAILLLILAAVAVDVLLARLRTHDWTQLERVAVYPIVGDHSLVTSKYVGRLEERVFEEIEHYLVAQAKRHGIDQTPLVDLQLRQQIDRLPPPPPAARGVLSTAWWSLRLRYWTWRVTRNDPRPDTRIRMFLVYHDPEHRAELPHSLGLRELLVGVTHVFASRRQQSVNNVVITHELMHTLGATDKYDPVSNQPLYPEGFAEPDRKPLYPQRFAEIMGGRVPLSSTEAAIPPALRATLVGTRTAKEIAWRK